MPVGGETVGITEKRNDIDWFAVELVAGRTYVIDLEVACGGALGAMLQGLYDGDGQRIAGTRNKDGGEGANARLTFTAVEDRTHYITAPGQGGTTGAYTVRVTGDPKRDGRRGYRYGRPDGAGRGAGSPGRGRRGGGRGGLPPLHPERGVHVAALSAAPGRQR